MAKRTTLMQIAKAAGVSISTVDRVINSRGGVSAKSEAKVLEHAQMLQLDRVAFRANLTIVRVAVLMQASTNPFYSKVQEAIAALAPDIQSMRLQVFVHHIVPTDAEGTSQKIMDLAQTYDCLVMICPAYDGLVSAVRAATKLVPVFTCVTDLPDTDRQAYVGPNNAQMGRVAGELMGRFLGPSGGRVLSVAGLTHFVGQAQRVQGFRHTLNKRFPACDILSADDTGEDQVRAAAVVRSLLQRYPDVRGIYSTTPGSREIAKVLMELGRAQEIVLIAHEISDAKRKLLLEGAIDVVIDQRPDTEMARLIHVIAGHFARSSDPAPDASFTPFDIILRENCVA